MATKDELQNVQKVTEERKAQTKEIREQVRLQDKEQTLVSKLNDSLKKQMDLRFSNNNKELIINELFSIIKRKLIYLLPQLNI